LTGADITVDRPAAALHILEDIPEAVSLCKKGCLLLGVFVDYVGNYEPHIIVYIENSSEPEFHLASSIATGWRPDQATDVWVPAITLKWKTTNPESKPPDWLNQGIEKMTFSPIAPAVETHRMSIFSKKSPVQLGTWKPSTK